MQLLRAYIARLNGEQGVFEVRSKPGIHQAVYRLWSIAELEMTCSRLYGIASLATDQSPLTSSSDISLRFAKERDQWKTMRLCQHSRSSLVIWRPGSLGASIDWLHNSSIHACAGVMPRYCHDQPSSRFTTWLVMAMPLASHQLPCTTSSASSHFWLWTRWQSM